MECKWWMSRDDICDMVKNKETVCHLWFFGKTKGGMVLIFQVKLLNRMDNWMEGTFNTFWRRCGKRDTSLLSGIFWIQMYSSEFQRHGKYPKWIQYVIYCSNTNTEFTISNRCRINSSKEIEDKKLRKIHNGVLFAEIPMYQSDIHGRLDVILCATFIENAFFR